MPVALALAAAVGVSLGRRGESGTLALPSTATVPAVAAPAQAISGQPRDAATVPGGASPTPPTPAPAPSGRQAGRYAGVTFVIGQGSKATFTVGETLAGMALPTNAVVSATALSGELHLDGRPSSIKLDLWRLSSDQPTRDRYIRSSMFPNDQFAVFTVDDPRAVPEGASLAQALDGRVRVTGTLSIRGRSAPLSFDLEGRDDGGVIYVLGRTTFTWKALGLEAPSSAAVLRVNEDVAVEVLLAGRPSQTNATAAGAPRIAGGTAEAAVAFV
jgi:polyisoprenoid-binding protein YceI